MMRLFLASLVFALLTWIIAAADKAGLEAPKKPPLLGVIHTQAARGVLIQKIMPDSAAERAGLKPRDIILALNGVAIRNPRHLFDEVQRYSSGTIVSIDYLRDGQQLNLQVALGARLDTASLIGQQAPAISLPVYGGGNYTKEPDKVTIVDFWATWCANCEGVRHTLEDFLRKPAARGIKIIGVTTEDNATIRNFYRGKNPPYAILIDATNDVTLKFRVEGYPTLAVIDKKGVVRFAGFASNGGMEKALELAIQAAKE